MRLIEKCCCGATLDIDSSYGLSWPLANAVQDFRDRHGSCLPSHPALDASEKLRRTVEADAEVRRQDRGGVVVDPGNTRLGVP